MLKNVPGLSGMTPWYHGLPLTMRQLPEMQDYYNRKGLVSDKGEKKKGVFRAQKTITNTCSINS